MLTKLFILIFSGGVNPVYNHPRYAADIQLMLDCLLTLQAFSIERLHILYGNGQQTFRVGEKPKSVLAGTATNLRQALANLATEIEEDDRFFFMATNHGGQLEKNTRKSTLWCWNQEQVEDIEFAARVKEIKSSAQIFLLGQCYSGGFIDKLEGRSRLVMTACDWNEVSYATVNGNYDEFLSHFCHALGRGAATFQEAFDYARKNDTRNETPQISDIGGLSLRPDLLRRRAFT